jgi:carbamoyl-phosphate synthase large subunit
MKIKRVLVLGSGAIKIGEAGEFDYSGAQAIKALKEEDVEVVLVNPNIATIQTDPKFADKVYLNPVNPEFVEKVIKKEKPDGILLGFGGQTALNCGVELEEQGILKKYGVKILGTSVESIQKAEDRDWFRKIMIENNIPIPRSKKANSLKQAKNIAEDLGYPVIIRVAYTLGGGGSGVAKNEKQLEKIVSRGLASSRIKQVLVEEYLDKWKEVEYEVMRDKEDNCIIICNMENFDPLGIHTGESIVIAPSQTLTNSEYHNLRMVSLKVIRALGIVGECNIQFALDPKSEKYKVIEVNPRLSRSSALASKATGYPIAYIATKISLGYTMRELMNKVTQVTSTFFEPALDYCVVKIPRWDFKKFRKVKGRIGTQMQSVGEVMGIGRCFEEALQKAVRMLNIDRELTEINELKKDEKSIVYELKHPSDMRLFYIMKAIKKGIPVKKIYKYTGIDKWFLHLLEDIMESEKNLRKNYSPELLRHCKRLGFSDKRIADILGRSEIDIRELRKKENITPVINQIDTLAAEWPAKTNYLYLTYGGQEDDIEIKKNKKVLVLGSGCYKIGSSVEFDWCCVNCAWELKKKGTDEVIMINYNPETVSTDFDVLDKLYFEELTLERVLDIVEKEKSNSVIVSVGGQIPNNLAVDLAENNVNILGTSAENIDRAEDRSKFSSLLDKLDIKQPQWDEVRTLNQAKNFSEKVGYPVLIRPSYVLSGAAMSVANDQKELVRYIKKASNISRKYPVVITKFITDAKEVEVDGVCNGQDVLIGAIIEHIENAGVHSGDATMSIPPLTISEETKEKIRNYTQKIAKSLHIKGPFNIQYLAKDGEIFVIECNLRASRSMPFTSKTTGRNLMEVAVDSMLGNKINIGEIVPRHYAIKVPQFSFMRLEDADPVLGVEMASTGEVACFGMDFSDAFLKALISSQLKIPLRNSSVLVTVPDEDKPRILDSTKILSELGFNIYATHGTSKFLKENGIKNKLLYKVSEEKKPNILDYLIKKKIDLVITIPPLKKDEDAIEDNYILRKTAIEFNIPTFMELNLAKTVVNSIKERRDKEFEVRAINEYLTAS